MQRIDAFYLYQVGWQVHPLLNFQSSKVTYNEIYYSLSTARATLNGLLYQSIFQVSTCQIHGQRLLAAIDNISNGAGGDNKAWDSLVPMMDVFNMQESVRAFEAVLQAEFLMKPVYFVTPKANQDINGLIESGHLSFPAELPNKVPEALLDAQEATKCIAFELVTAAGFHLHRANEAVLRRYFDHVAGPQNRPKSRNLGDYLKKLDTLNVGNEKVKAALRDLKDLHRNPLMHPEEHIASVDDAISLMGGVRQAMTLMLKELPAVPESPAFPSLTAEQAFGPGR